MSATLAASRVPVEFIGLARLLRDRIAAEDRPSGEGMGRLTEDVRSRIRRGNPVPRAVALSGLAHGWRHKLPPLSRLGLEIDLNARRKTIVIRESRLTSSGYRDQGWDEDATEIGLIINLIQVRVGPSDYEFRFFTLSHISLHALARRFQRGLDVGEAAILRDLKALGEATLTDGAAGDDFVVPVPGGRWVGGVQAVRNRGVGPVDTAMIARTYYSDEDA